VTMRAPDPSNGFSLEPIVMQNSGIENIENKGYS